MSVIQQRLVAHFKKFGKPEIITLSIYIPIFIIAVIYKYNQNLSYLYIVIMVLLLLNGFGYKRLQKRNATEKKDENLLFNIILLFSLPLTYLLFFDFVFDWLTFLNGIIFFDYVMTYLMVAGLYWIGYDGVDGGWFFLPKL